MRRSQRLTLSQAHYPVTETQGLAPKVTNLLHGLDMEKMMTDEEFFEGEQWETIVASAVVLDGDVWQLPKPARHHHVLWALDQVLPGRAIEAHDQGFVTNTGRYVDREEAARIAVRAKQVARLHAPPNLYSEDLW
jgi:hypothetical protein